MYDVCILPLRYHHSQMEEGTMICDFFRTSFVDDPSEHVRKRAMMLFGACHYGG